MPMTPALDLEEDAHTAPTPKEDARTNRCYRVYHPLLAGQFNHRVL